MKKRFFIFLAIALTGFAIILNFAGCKKKDKPKEAPSVEETTEDDITDDDDDAETD